MKVIGVLGEEFCEATLERINAVASPEYPIAGIWDTQNNRILVGLDDDANTYEKSFGPTGTHYSMRVINSLYVSEFELDVNLINSDHIPGCVDFDIWKRDIELVANLPHKIAQFIPGVTGVDKAQVKRSWNEVFNSRVIRQFQYAKSPNSLTHWEIERSIKKIAKASNVSDWEFQKDLFGSLKETENLEVAIVVTKSKFKNIHGSYSDIWTVALSHQDAGFTGDEICKNGQVSITWNRHPSLELEIRNCR